MFSAKIVKTTLAQLRPLGCRNFTNSSVVSDIKAFLMPAMSPTMDKGGIIDWKFKVGEPFNAGDVILEVETDKAQIDVEAQDDGKFASIVMNAGSKNVNVGEPIAYIAEIDDDISNFEPEKSAAKPKELEIKEQLLKEKESQKVAVSNTSNTTLLPSVQILLHQNGISNIDALKIIKGTGKDGKILKGDIMEHLGQIPKESAKQIAEYIAKTEKLSLPKLSETTKEVKKEQIEGERSIKETISKDKEISNTTEPIEEKVEKVKKIEIEPPTPIKQIVTLMFPESMNYNKLDITITKILAKLYQTSHKTQSMDTKSKLYDPLFEDLLIIDPHKIRFNYDYHLSKIDETGNRFTLMVDILRFNQYNDAKFKTDNFIKQLKTIQDLLL